MNPKNANFIIVSAENSLPIKKIKKLKIVNFIIVLVEK